MTARVSAPLWVSALLLLLFLGLAAAASFIDPIERYFTGGNPLRVETTVPEQVAVGQPFRATMLVTNLLNRPSTRFYVEFGEDFLATAEWSDASPRPLRIDRSYNRLILVYDALPPRGQRPLQFSFIARGKGVMPFTVRIYAPSNQLQHNIVAPIKVTSTSV
jgi:hypothetical protein